MSITYTDLIADALRELNVISEIQTPSAEQASHALRKLDQMMAEWLVNGIDLQYMQVTDADLSQTMTIPQYAEIGVTCQLAIRLASNYGATVSPEIAAAAMSGMETIEREALKGQLTPTPMHHVPIGAGDCRRRGIWPWWTG